jgi:hypothetical protein
MSTNLGRHEKTVFPAAIIFVARSDVPKNRLKQASKPLKLESGKKENYISIVDASVTMKNSYALKA